MDHELICWKERARRKPIILRGARQVGKTTVVRELGKTFEQFIEINFEETPELSSLFESSLEPDLLLQQLSNYLGIKIIEHKTLLFLDEIQECPRAILALRYFYEKFPNLHVISAGSLLDFELEKISFPVGRVDFYYVYPMSFGEYLEAIGKSSLRKALNSSQHLSTLIHHQLNGFMRDYTLVGGMPEVVSEFTHRRDLKECQHIQTSIIETYLADFPKFSKKHQVKYLSKVFSAIPAQLGRKFKYSNVSNLFKSRELSEALDLLVLAGLATKIHHSSSNGIPLEAEKDDKKFKVLFFDVGLAMRLLHVPIQELLLNDDITLVNEGAIAEQLVGQELRAYSSCREHSTLFYWHREAKSSNAEVDYVIEQGGKVVPIEVKSGLGGRKKSLMRFIEEKSPHAAICLSTDQASESNDIQYCPLYQIEVLMKGRENHIHD